jgi:hypothetical protein
MERLIRTSGATIVGRNPAKGSYTLLRPGLSDVAQRRCRLDNSVPRTDWL